MLAFVIWNIYFCIIYTNDVDNSGYSLLGKGGGFHLDFQNVPFLFQSFLGYLLQEAAVEPCESIDRKEYLERDWGVLQTYGWAMCLACVELRIYMDGGNQVLVFRRLCVLKTELSVVFSSVGADVTFPSTCSLNDWLYSLRVCLTAFERGLQARLADPIFYPYREWTAANWSLDGHYRRSHDLGLKVTTTPASSQTYLFSPTGREGERERGGRHGQWRASRQGSQRAEGQERSQ